MDPHPVPTKSSLSPYTTLKSISVLTRKSFLPSIRLYNQILHPFISYPSHTCYLPFPSYPYFATLIRNAKYLGQCHLQNNLTLEPNSIHESNLIKCISTKCCLCLRCALTHCTNVTQVHGRAYTHK
jgi:hypothetical protein